MPADPAPGPPERGPRAHPRHRVRALLRPGHPGGRRRPDHRRVRRRQGDLLQALPGQGRPRRGLPRQGRRSLVRPAQGSRRGGRSRPGEPARRPLRRPVERLPPGGLPRLRLHQRRRGVAARAPPCTTARSPTRRPCSPGCATSPSRPARATPGRSPGRSPCSSTEGWPAARSTPPRRRLRSHRPRPESSSMPHAPDRARLPRASADRERAISDRDFGSGHDRVVA